MSQFYANIQGNRGEATRTGNKSSGLVGHICGWNIGAKVIMSHVDGKDIVAIYKTAGSNAFYHGESELIAEFTEE